VPPQPPIKSTVRRDQRVSDQRASSVLADIEQIALSVMKHANVSGFMPTASVPQSDRNGSTNDDASPSTRQQTNRLAKAGAPSAARAATRRRSVRDNARGSSFIVVIRALLSAGGTGKPPRTRDAGRPSRSRVRTARWEDARKGAAAHSLLYLCRRPHRPGSGSGCAIRRPRHPPEASAQAPPEDMESAR